MEGENPGTEEEGRQEHNEEEMKEVDKELLNASAAGQLEIVKKAVEAGASCESRDKEDNTALMLAIQNKQAKVVSFLLERGSRPGPSEAVAAKREQRWDRLTNKEKKLLDKELVEASQEGELDQVIDLLSRGANIQNQSGYNLTTSLMWALANNHSQVSLHLLAQGADLFLTNQVGYVVFYKSSHYYLRIAQLYKYSR